MAESPFSDKLTSIGKKAKEHEDKKTKAIWGKTKSSRSAIGAKAEAKSNSRFSSGKRQALPTEDLVIDPLTHRQAGPDYYKRMAEEASRPDPMEELLNALSEKYSGTMPGYDDSEAIAALDSALGNTLAGFGKLRDTTNANYRESDANLQSMHDAYRNDIQTNGAKAYNGISDTLVNSNNQNRDSSVASLTAAEDESRNKRAAMLRSLGIEEAAAAPESSVLSDAKTNIVNRTNTDQSFAESQRATNQSYNTGVAESVGAAGVQRRSELQRQLGQALGTIDAKEMDAQTAYQNQRAQIASQRAGNQNNRAQFEYGMYQDEQQGLRDQLESMMQGGEPTKVSGYSGLAQDLINSGVDQGTASNAIKAHAEIIASPEYMKARQKGQDPTAYTVGELTRRGIPVSVALQYVTNYNNLGSTSSYQAMQ